MSNAPSRKPVYWIGEAVAECQVSKRPITTRFVDGNIPRIGWACVHPDCFREHGGTFGLGRGQLYEKQSDGQWLKIEG